MYGRKRLAFVIVLLQLQLGDANQCEAGTWLEWFEPLRNEGKGCWDACGRRDGPCDWCGSGYCCRHDWDGGGCTKRMGIAGWWYHTCVPGPTEPGSVGLINFGSSNCWGNCGDGPCPHTCGSGYCCRLGYANSGVCYGRGINDDHRCVPRENTVCTPCAAGTFSSGGASTCTTCTQNACSPGSYRETCPVRLLGTHVRGKPLPAISDSTILSGRARLEPTRPRGDSARAYSVLLARSKRVKALPSAPAA
jgi:hypothetical protein